MDRATTIIKRILWISALIILVLGIIFFARPFNFPTGLGDISLSGAHVGAITSGILSLVSFGYHLMRKNPLPTLIGIVHVSATLLLLGLVIYYRFMMPADLLDVPFPNLDSSPETVSYTHLTLPTTSRV